MEQTITQQSPVAVKPSLISVGELFKRSWQMFKAGFWRLVALKGVGIAIKLAFILPFVALAIWVFVSSADSLVPEQGDFFQPELLEEPLEQTGLPLLAATVSQGVKFFPELPNFGILFGVGFVLILALAIVSYWLNASLLVMVRDLSQELGVKDSLKQALKQGWKILLSFILVGILQGLAVFGGFLLFVAPGIIFAVWFVFSPYVLICEGVRGTAALKRSKALVSGYWWGVLGRMLLLSLIGFGLMLFGYIIPGLNLIGAIFLSLFSAVYYYQLYHDLVRLKKLA